MRSITYAQRMQFWGRPGAFSEHRFSVLDCVQGEYRQDSNLRPELKLYRLAAPPLGNTSALSTELRYLQRLKSPLAWAFVFLAFITRETILPIILGLCRATQKPVFWYGKSDPENSSH